MWKRSDVERLTGLTRHMIQDLCNPNTSRDGLGFWEPAISKPGYSRFDEGDLLAFYLVRQLMKAGFTLREIESAVFDLMEDDDSFERALRRKATVLHRRRAELDSKLSALEYLEVAATAATDDRLYAVMEVALTQSAERAVQVATTETQRQRLHGGAGPAHPRHDAGAHQHRATLAVLRKRRERGVRSSARRRCCWGPRRATSRCSCISLSADLARGQGSR